MSIATILLGRVKRCSSLRGAWRVFTAALLLLSAGCPGGLPVRDLAAPDTPVAQEGGLTFQDIRPSDGTTRDRRLDAQLASERRRDGVSGKSCKEVLDCGMKCPSGADLTCINACLASACPSASALAQSMYLCGVKVCVADCAAGFGQTCLLCLVLHCPTEYNACLAHTSCGP